jgi:hypothetical protein
LILKWILGIGLVVVLGLGIGVYSLYSNLDSLIVRAIEEYGSEAAGAAVRVDGVSLDLEAGRASVYGLRVNNPPGFKGQYAFTLGEITVDIDLDSLVERNPIVLDEIRIESPVVFFELDESRRSNLDVLKDNAGKSSGDGDGSDGSTTDSAGSSRLEPRLTIRRLRFSGGRVQADAQAIGGGEIDAKLATAVLSNVGGRKGATGSEIGAIVVEELGRQTALAIGRDQIGKLLKGKVGKEGRKAIDAVEGLMNRFRK